MDGVLLISKPSGPTSHDIVARLRRLAGTKRVGHAGTLDPMASGLLVCCVGRATRIVPFLVGMRKEYTGEMTLGAMSDTYDALGQITAADGSAASEGGPAPVDMEQLREIFRGLTGSIEQAAPPYSAIRYQGKKLYEYARRGEAIPPRVRTVWVERFVPLRYLPPKVTFVARVGSGTYIRSLAHEAGKRLGCGAYLSALCRTQVGGFCLDDAVSLEGLEADPEALRGATLDVAEALVHLPKLVLLPGAEARLRHGLGFGLGDIAEMEGSLPVGQPVLVLAGAGEALAIAQAEDALCLFRPLCVLAPHGAE